MARLYMVLLPGQDYLASRRNVLKQKMKAPVFHLHPCNICMICAGNAPEVIDEAELVPSPRRIQLQGVWPLCTQRCMSQTCIKSTLGSTFYQHPSRKFEQARQAHFCPSSHHR